MKWFLLFIHLFLAVVYLGWRLLFTFNQENTFTFVLSVLLYAAELYFFIYFLLFYFITARPTNRSSPPLPDRELPPVDIFVPVTTASLDDLYRTVVGCQALDYPSRKTGVTVIDGSSKREEMRTFAEKMGCRYVEGEVGASPEKLLDSGLAGSNGELVLLVRCGHVPVRSYLRQTAGFFEEARIGFVRTPYYSLASDPLQQALLLDRHLSNERKLNQKVFEPGLDRYGAATPSDTGTLFRRSALNELLSCEPEAMTTSLSAAARLLSFEWKSAYLNKNLLFSTLVREKDNFFRERAERFSKAARLLLTGLPLRRKLSLAQRLASLGLLMTDINVLPRIVFMLLPLFFMAGLSPIVAEPWHLALFFIPLFLVQTVTLNLFGRQYRHPLFTAVYDTAAISSVLIALTGRFFSGDASDLTSGRLSKPIIPLALLWLFNFVGLLVGGVFLARGQADGGGILIGAVWLAYNILLLTAAIASAYGRTQKRGHPRIFREVECHLKGSGMTWPARSVEISEGGLSLIMNRPEPLPENVEIELGVKSPITLGGEVTRNEPFSGERTSVGIRFVGMTEEKRKALQQWIYTSQDEWEEENLDLHTHGAALSALVTSAARIFTDELDLHRAAPRYNVQAPCRLILPNKVMTGKTIDVSSAGILVHLNEEPGPLTGKIIVEVSTPGGTGSGDGRTVWSRRDKEGWLVAIHLAAELGAELLNTLIPLATLKTDHGESFQTRVIRTMERMAAWLLSISLAVVVVVVAFREGVLSIPSPDIETLSYFFWLFVIFLLIDGLKVFVEIAHRAPPRQYKSDLSEVTALIPCHNTGKAVVYTIDGLLRMLPKEQIIVVDDGSSDDTAEIARRTGVRVISLERNMGKVRAVWEGLKHVRSLYVLLLDDDVRFQSLFLPTSLLEEGNTAVAFYVLPCRRVRENYNGKDLVNCLQRYEYAKSMEIGKRFQDKTVSVSCVSGASGLFHTERLRYLESLHSRVYPGEDLERTLLNLIDDGRIAFVNDPAWTVCPDNWRDLTRQRLHGWYPGFYRLAGYYLKILLSRKMPGRLRFEMLYSLYVLVSDPLKIVSLGVLLANHSWGALAFLYFFYLALELYPFIVVEKKLPVMRYYLPALVIFPLYGIYNTFLRFGGFLVWLWHRYVTKKWKPAYEKKPS